MKYKKVFGERVFDYFNIILMSLFVITIIYPFWNMIMESVASNDVASKLGFSLWNEKFDTSAYDYLLVHDKTVFRAYFITTLRTILGVSISLLATICGGYAISKKNLPGRKIIIVFFLITMFFNGGLIPNYLLIRNLGLFNTIWALVLPHTVSVFNLIIMRNFMIAIDKSMEESAFIDGAGYIKILMKIVLPLSKPVIATITLWISVMHWNSWFDAMIYTSGDKLIVLQLMVRNMMRDLLDAEQYRIQAFNENFSAYIERENVQAALTLLSIGPIILVYPFLQKHFVKGIMLGAVKS